MVAEGELKWVSQNMILLHRGARRGTLPSIEGLVALTCLNKIGEWSIEAHREQLDQYFEIRATPMGLHAPRIFDAALCLALAERYRGARDFDRMRSMVSKAVLTFRIAGRGHINHRENDVTVPGASGEDVKQRPVL